MTDPLEPLVERAANGDRSAVAALLEAYLPGLRAYIRLQMGRAVREHESCSDLAQSVCREVLQNLDRFRYPGEAAFRKWLYTTAARKIAHRDAYWHAEKRDVDRVASQPSEPQGDGDVLACYGTFCTPSRVAIAREELARIEGAFDRLSEEHREVIVKARILGMSRAEIGEDMGRNEAAVGNLLFRALSRLSEILDDQGA